MTTPRRKAVENGLLNYTSASAINRLAFGCETSYYFRYVEGLPDPAGKAAELGTQTHGRLEWYLKTGEDVLGRHERVALNAGLIPKPGGPGKYENKHPDPNVTTPLMLDILAEGKVDGVLDLDGIPMSGGMDLFDPRGPVPVLTDWKTKGDISEVAAVIRNHGPPYEIPTMQVNHDELVASLTDPDTEYGLQMIAYAEAARRRFPWMTHIILRHVYIQTRGSLVGETRTGPVAIADISRLWQRVSHAWSGPLRKVAAAKRPEDTTPNTGHCYKFHKPCNFHGACPFFGAPSSNNLVDILGLGGTQVGLLDKFKTGAVDPSIVQPKDSTPSIPLPPAPRQFVIRALYRLPNGQQGILTQINGTIGKFVVGEGTPAEASIDVALAIVGEQESAGALEAPAPKPVEQTTAQEEAPKKRGRKPKVEEPAEATPPVLAPPTTNPSAVLSIVHLYIGCAPIGIETKTLHAYADGVERAILKELGETLPDIRLSGHEMLSFGKWKAVLGQSVIKSPPPPGYYVVPGIPGEKLQVVVDALTSLLSNIPGAVVAR